jgi:hypothetical protein
VIGGDAGQCEWVIVCDFKACFPGSKRWKCNLPRKYDLVLCRNPNSIYLVAFGVSYKFSFMCTWLEFGSGRSGFLWNMRKAGSSKRLKV